MAKIYIETNFSFPNLVKKYNQLQKKASKGIHKTAAKTAKQMIRGGKLKPLAPSTKKQRKSGGDGNIPLYKTKALYRSIKGDAKGLHMFEYGKWHNDGDRRPLREFVKFDEEAQNKFTKAFIEEIHRALKK